MLKIALTGGIGSGKSTVCDIFRERGATVVSADQVARDLVQSGSESLAEIVSEFGEDILDDQGQLNRQKLREIIFTDPAAKQRLEEILHPKIMANMHAQLATIEAPYAILEIPLLVESGLVDGIDRVLLVACDPALQIKRTMGRDQVSAKHVEKILHSQADHEQRLAIADDVIMNNKDIEDLVEQVKTLDEKYRNL